MLLNLSIKTTLLAFILIGLSGCGAKLHYDYKSETLIDSSKEYKINIVMTKDTDAGLFITDIKNVVTVYINDEIALKGKLNKDASGELKGTYNGKELTLECVTRAFYKPTSCLIHLNKKRIGNLDLKINI